MKKIRIGLVGLAQGDYAGIYLRNCKSSSLFEIVGICDLGMKKQDAIACAFKSAEEVASEADVPLLHDFKDLLNLKLDALIITTESVEHHIYAIQAIEAGIHTLIAKPMTINVSDAITIDKVAEKYPKVIVLPGQSMRFDDGVRQAKEQIIAGKIGKPIMAHIFISHPAWTNHEWEMDVNRSGGPLVEYGSNAVDMVEYLIDSPIQSLSAMGKNFIYPMINGPDNIKVLAKHQNETLSSLDINSSITWRYPRIGIEIIGDKGCVRSDYHNYPIHVHSKDSYEITDPIGTPMLARQVVHFANCIYGKEKPITTTKDYISTMQVLETIQKSINLDSYSKVIRNY